MTLNCDDMVLALHDAPIDQRTGNRVVYAASWVADRNSMIGKRNEDWVRRELNWFRSGSNKLSDMEPPVPGAFQACAGIDGSVSSAYGHILFGMNYRNDPEPELPEFAVGEHLASRAFRALKANPATRHGVIIVSDRNVHGLHHKNGRNDFICTNALNFMVEDVTNKLHLIVQMRSMDAVWGYRADYSMWDYLMDDMVDGLQDHHPDIVRGDIIFQVANLHVYPRHFALLERAYQDAEARLTKQVFDNMYVRSAWGLKA